MDDLERAIRERLVVELSYDGGMRIVEPHVLFEDQEGCHLVRMWQVDGFSHEPWSLPQWRCFFVDKLAELQVLRSHFGTRPDAKQGLEGATVLVSAEG